MFLHLCLLLLVSATASGWSFGFGFGAARAVADYAPFDNDANAVEGFPHLATDGRGNWIAVWNSSVDDGMGTAGEDADIFFSTSSNNGNTWSSPGIVNTNFGSDNDVLDLEPRVQTDADGTWIVVWYTLNLPGGALEDFDVLYSRSTDFGQNWSAPAPLNTNASNDTSWDQYPKLANNGNDTWMVVWEARDLDGGPSDTDEDILVVVSANDGASWSMPMLLNNDATTDTLRDGAPALAADQNGTWICTWEEGNRDGSSGQGTNVVYARSTTNGLSWSDPAILNANPEPPAFNNDQPTIATDQLGNWVVMWESTDPMEQTLGADRDIMFARSSDSGVSWQPAAVAGDGQTSDTRRAQSPELAADGAGNWVAVWTSEREPINPSNRTADIRGVRSSDDGTSWGAVNSISQTSIPFVATNPPNPNIAAGDGQRWVSIWNSRANLNATLGTDDDILYATTDNLDATGISSSFVAY
jgi:hypothetical protein